MDWQLSEKLRAWGTANGYTTQELEACADYFGDYLANKTGKPYKDLDAAFRNCVRSDWGNIRRNLKYAAKTPVKQPQGSIAGARPGESWEDYLRRVAG